MTARSDSLVEAQFAMAGALAAVEGRLTQLVDSIRGQVVNGVLFAGTVTLDANGMYMTSFEVPFGSVAIGNSTAGTVSFQNEGPQVSAPLTGVGVFTVAAGKSATVPIAGRALTLYGAAGGSVQLSVYDRPLGAASLGPVTAAGVNPTTGADADAGANLTGSQTAVAHNYVYNGATWDRIRTAISDAQAAIGLQGVANQAFNGATWDRIRNAAGAQSSALADKALHVAAGAPLKVSLSAVTVAGVGASLDNLVMRKDHVIQILGTGVGISLNFEISMDNSTWVPVTPTAVAGGGGTVVGSAGTTNGFYTVLGVPARFVRANLTALTSGSVTAYVSSA